MTKIRGLNTSQFVFYSPKFGVKLIATRWLLSYHRGPLVEAEIKMITPVIPEDKLSHHPEAEITRARRRKPRQLPLL